MDILAVHICLTVLIGVPVVRAGTAASRTRHRVASPRTKEGSPDCGDPATPVAAAALQGVCDEPARGSGDCRGCAEPCQGMSAGLVFLGRSGSARGEPREEGNAVDQCSGGDTTI